MSLIRSTTTFVSRPSKFPPPGGLVGIYRLIRLSIDLCSHSAIQGTARPVHYTVLMDEIGLPVNQLHAMLYEQCYSYVRSTTPVSLRMFQKQWVLVRGEATTANTFEADPAVYYAHLASNRARHHENVAASLGPRTGPDMSKAARLIDRSTVDVPDLLPFAGTDECDIDKSMWYI